MHTSFSMHSKTCKFQEVTLSLYFVLKDFIFLVFFLNYWVNVSFFNRYRYTPYISMCYLYILSSGKILYKRKD